MPETPARSSPRAEAALLAAFLIALAATLGALFCFSVPSLMAGSIKIVPSAFRPSHRAAD